MSINTQQEIKNAQLHESNGNLHEAEKVYQKILVEDPGNIESLNHLAFIRARNEDFLGAKTYLEKIIQLKPDYAGAYSNLGNCFTELSDLSSAQQCFEKAIQINPREVDAYYNLANTFCKLKEYERAVAAYQTALALNNQAPHIYFNLGNTFTLLGKFADAIRCYTTIQAAYENNKDFCSRFAHAFFLERNYIKSIDWLLKCLKVDDKNPETYNRIGQIYALIGRDHESLEFYRRAYACDEENEISIYNIGIGCLRLAQFSEGYQYAARLKTLSNRSMLQHYYISILAEWSQWDEVTRQLIENKLTNGVTGWDLLRVLDSAREQHEFMKHFTSVNFPAQATLAAFPPRLPSKKIKIGYFSPDFRNHAVMHLSAEIFKNHNRNDFEVHGFSLYPHHTPDEKKQLQTYFDHLHEINEVSDLEVAKKCREIGLDIAVDLTGNTRGLRTEIFALRAAPVQVNFLGYTGTMGADYYDYIIADPVVIPPDSQDFYSEKVVYLKSFMPRQVHLLPSAKSISRAQHHLPNEGFVYCCFNKSFKFNPQTFNSWLRILTAVPMSVLWFNGVPLQTQKNLKKFSSSAGVDPSRLIFADPVLDMSSHLARHKLAGLFLDTFPYNAHTTASDALWSGLPVLTRMGDSFASRVSASLLTALGMPELITKSVEEYEALAIHIGKQPQLAAEYRKKLKQNLRSERLFDMAAYMAEFESVLKTMHQRRESGLAPATIDAAHGSR